MLNFDSARRRKTHAHALNFSRSFFTFHFLIYAILNVSYIVIDFTYFKLVAT